MESEYNKRTFDPNCEDHKKNDCLFDIQFPTNLTTILFCPTTLHTSIPFVLSLQQPQLRSHESLVHRRTNRD
ncbi:hypothetical protein BLNAU_22061 [Blattamonas nauphoetae]|uniref:Uncharacterized protein n=1 Tax=Blattamonas nauphoetae TaxID=2049346 RepID=A0ABQ9WU50_9EUKA|nr:hypothetical protein BLNAU_22061 [Blattamonas nauphoetae]